MPHSAKDTLGKPQQSFDSSSFLLFVTAAHTHLSTPFHPFISFPDWSKVLICQGSLPAPPAVTGILRAGCFPVCWCRAGVEWERLCRERRGPQAAPCRDLGGAARVLGWNRVGKSHNLFLKCKNVCCSFVIGTSAFTDTFGFTATHTTTCRNSSYLALPRGLGEEGSYKEGQHSEMQVSLLLCRQRRHEADGNQNYFKKYQNY